MEYKTKKTLFFISFGVLLYAAVINLQAVGAFITKIGGLVFPILLGMILAFMLSVPMKGFENLFIRLFSRVNKNQAVIFFACLVLLLLCFVSY